MKLKSKMCQVTVLIPQKYIDIVNSYNNKFNNAFDEETLQKLALFFYLRDYYEC